MKEDKSNTKYCMELDIHHFYNNISQEVVINKLKTLVKDFKFLEVCERMISCGILIGAYYSQWFANMILENLDKEIRLCDGVAYYCRYMDNITIFGPNKKKLHKAKIIIEQELSKLRLQLKSNWQIFPTKSRKPNALGYVYGHGYTMLRKATKLKLIRAINKYKRKKKNKKKITYKMACSIMSRLRAM